tara:strand:+ start:4596 stop:5741 length:1146 start_codon:yes stop_codon:yes gene_type:complete
VSKRASFTSFAKGSPRNVDREKGIIYDAKIIEVGEASGHDLFVDGEFIDSVVEAGAGLKQGLKARFGHPNMCSTTLGTFLGRWKGLYRDGDDVRGNLFLSQSAKDAPGGDLYDYVLSMAENDPDMFGVSISFDRDTEAEELAGIHEDTNLQLCRLSKLSAGDCVDSPAATSGGLFSAFTNDSIAGQVTEFLNDHPDVWDAFEKNPSILEALSEYGDKMDEFTNRYRSYRGQEGDIDMSEEETTVAESTEENADKSALETGEGSETAEETETEVELAEGTEITEGETTEDEVDDVSASSEESESSLSVDDFKKIVEEFGSDIAAQTVLSGGTYIDALKASHEALKADNAALREGSAASEETGGTPAKVIAASTKKPLFKVKS